MLTVQASFMVAKCAPKR
jgi:hypothetical protein